MKEDHAIVAYTGTVYTHEDEEKLMEDEFAGNCDRYDGCTHTHRFGK
jgi:hypothetical protein